MQGQTCGCGRSCACTGPSPRPFHTARCAGPRCLRLHRCCSCWLRPQSTAGRPDTGGNGTTGCSSERPLINGVRFKKGDDNGDARRRVRLPLLQNMAGALGWKRQKFKQAISALLLSWLITMTSRFWWWQNLFWILHYGFAQIDSHSDIRNIWIYSKYCKAADAAAHGGIKPLTGRPDRGIGAAPTPSVTPRLNTVNTAQAATAPLRTGLYSLFLNEHHVEPGSSSAEIRSPETRNVRPPPASRSGEWGEGRGRQDQAVWGRRGWPDPALLAESAP